MSTSQLTGCAKCATIGRTCCQQREILVTEGDKARIARHTGQTAFWAVQKAEDPAYFDQPNDANWLKWAFNTDGTRPILHRQPGGDCTFLGPRGCTLPTPVRPLVCRLYPYDYTQAGIAGIAGECPPAVVPPGSTLLKVLDMRLPEALHWHKMLYTELETKEPFDESRTDVRLAS